MKTFRRKLFLGFACFIFASIATFGGYFYIFDSDIKANYYFKIATDLDENMPSGSSEALRYYQKAIKSYTNTGNKRGAVEAYINLGLLHYKFGNILQVERMVLQALDLGDEEIPEGMKSKIYLLLASTLEPESARKYIDKSLEISKRLNLNVMEAEAYFLLGQTNEYKADFENAEKNYLNAIAAVNNFSSLDKFFDAANLYERLAELYAGGGETDKAIQYYYEALGYSMREERGFVTANYMKIIGDLYQENREMAKACDMWNQSKEEYAFFGAVAPFSVSAVKVPRPCDTSSKLTSNAPAESAQSGS